MNRLLLFALFISLFSLGCEEIPPTINPIMGPTEDTTVVDVGDQQRQVVIEEFTGVRCVQCPGGSAEIESLKIIYGEQLIAISIHAGGFSPPYSESLYDFRTEEGDQLLEYLGDPFGYPSAVINRKLFEGEFDLQLGKAQWAGFIQDESMVDPKVKIGITTSYNATTRELEVEATLFVQEDILEENVRITALITEDDVKDYQETPGGLISDYSHKHALRDMFTNYDGDPLTPPLLAGTEVVKSYSMVMDDEWVVDNCNVIVFVNLGGDSLEILQANEVRLTE